MTTAPARPTGWCRRATADDTAASQTVQRMVFGNKIIDHERVTGVPGAPLEVAAIYEVGEGAIGKVWFVNAT